MTASRNTRGLNKEPFQLFSRDNGAAISRRGACRCNGPRFHRRRNQRGGRVLTEKRLPPCLKNNFDRETTAQLPPRQRYRRNRCSSHLRFSLQSPVKHLQKGLKGILSQGAKKKNRVFCQAWYARDLKLFFSAVLYGRSFSGIARNDAKYQAYA